MRTYKTYYEKPSTIKSVRKDEERMQQPQSNPYNIIIPGKSNERAPPVQKKLNKSALQQKQDLEMNKTLSTSQASL